MCIIKNNHEFDFSQIKMKWINVKWIEYVLCNCEWWKYIQMDLFMACSVIHWDYSVKNKKKYFQVRWILTHWGVDQKDEILQITFHNAFFWRQICVSRLKFHFDGLVQERHNSTANALELRLSCTNPST